MFLITTLAVVLAMIVLARILVRRLGWPTDLAGAGRWCLALLAIAACIASLPVVFPLIENALGTLPTISIAEVVPVLLLLGLSGVGGVAWHRGKLEQHRGGNTAPRFPERKRVFPPPPAPEAPQHGGVFTPVGTEAPALDDVGQEDQP